MRSTTNGTFPLIQALPGDLLKPIQAFQEQVDAALAAPLFPSINSAHTTVPTITSADIGGTMQNTNVTAGNFAVQSFKNAAADQVYVGAQFIGPGSTAGGNFFIATRPAGGSLPIEQYRISSAGIHTIDPTAGGSLTDGSSFALSNWRMTRNLDPANGLFYLMNLQPYATAVSGGSAYEKAGLIIQAKTNDPSTSLISRDMVAADLRSTIVSTNSLGRAYALNAQGIIESGGDGLSYAIECGVVNGGSDQPLVDTTTSKYGIQITAGGNGASAGLKFIGSGGGFHKMIYANPADILGTNAADSFIELLSTWRVKKDGTTGIGTSSPSSFFQVLDQSNYSFNIEGNGGGASQTYVIAQTAGASASAVPFFVGKRSRGTIASPASLSSGDELFRLGVMGYHSSSAYDSARKIIVAQTTEAWTVSAMGYDVGVWTRPNGTASTPTERIRITHDGLVGIGTASPGATLTVAGSIGATTITASSLTSGRVPIISTAGLLIDDADLTFSGGDTLTGTKMVGSTSVTTPLLSASANLNIAPTGNVGVYGPTFGTSAAKNFVLATGATTPTSTWSSFPSGAHFFVKEEVDLLLGGTGVSSDSKGSHLNLWTKGFAVRGHMAVGDFTADAALSDGVDKGIISSYYPSIALNVRATFTGDFSATGLDATTGLTVAKRQGIASYVETTATAGLKSSDEVYGVRSVIRDFTNTVTHAGKYYAATGELVHMGSAGMDIARGFYGVYQKEGTGLTADAKGVLGLLFLATVAGSTITLGDGVYGAFNVIAPATVTQGNAVRGRLEVTLSSGTFTSPDYRTVRASAPLLSITGSGALAITKLAGLSCGDFSSIAGVTNAYGLLVEGVNAQNSIAGATLFGGEPLEADTLPQFGLLQGQSAYGLASTNVTGGNLMLTGGFGRRLFTVVSIGLGTVTLTVTVNGTSQTFLSGTDFLYGASTTTAATNLAAAINANATLNVKLLAVASTNTVYLRRRGLLYTLTIATSDAARTSVASGDDGPIDIRGNMLVSKDWPSSAATNLLATYDSYGDNPRFVIRRANGTQVSPSAVVSGDSLGIVQFRGYHSSSAFTTSAVASIAATAEQNFTSGAWGTRFTFNTVKSGTTTLVEALRIDNASNVIVGAAALATNATDGFLYIPGGAGAPTGVPTAYTGRYALYWNTTNKKLYVYDGAWLGGTTPGAFT